MVKQKLHFLSGLPRTGSTVLTSLLSQNPEVYCSGTSAFGNMFNQFCSNWDEMSKNTIKQYPKQKYNIAKGMLNSAYLHIEKPVIIDKNRFWPQNSTLVADSTKAKPKIITTVRDISSIITSFYNVTSLLAQNRNIIKDLLSEQKIPYNKTNVCMCIWETQIKPYLHPLKAAYEQNKEYFHFVEYDDLVNDPKATLKSIYDFLELKQYKKHTFDNLYNPEPEYDEEVYGAKGLHEVRPVLAKTSTPAKEVLGLEIYNFCTQQKLEFWRN